MNALLKENPPKKIECINALAASGKSRNEIAEALGYKDYRGLYAFMNRQGLEWNPHENLYVIKGSRTAGASQETAAIHAETPSGKVGNILIMFNKGLEGKDIAQKLRFGSHQEMADFMKGKGYVWDNKRQNYIKNANIPRFSGMVAESEPVYAVTPNSEMTAYNDILSLLSANKDKLIEILKPSTAAQQKIPRYCLPGRTIPKSLSMASPLERLIKEFSEENNLSQKEIIEVAVVEFLKKYGYEEQVKTILYL